MNEINKKFAAKVKVKQIFLKLVVINELDKINKIDRINRINELDKVDKYKKIVLFEQDILIAKWQTVEMQSKICCSKYWF